MTRAIKFRSWANGSMWNVNALACSDGSEQMDLVDDSIGGYDDVSLFDNAEDRVIMQYVGVKDKNGKDIYEGDVVYVKNMLVETVPPYRAVVEWDKYRYCVRNLNTPNYSALQFPYNNLDIFGLDIEVIGNIYENPELLEGR